MLSISELLGGTLLPKALTGFNKRTILLLIVIGLVKRTLPGLMDLLGQTELVLTNLPEQTLLSVINIAGIPELVLESLKSKLTSK